VVAIHSSVRVGVVLLATTACARVIATAAVELFVCRSHRDLGNLQ
jgi:hypothetical protein